MDSSHRQNRNVLCPNVLCLALCLSLLSLLSACGKTGETGNGPVMFTQDRNLLVVPANSPLRSHLAIQTVESSGAKQTIDLPASVEADPHRVVNILAPLTGRVAALNVQIGDHVKRGQVMAVIASGDMAQAIFDDDKARDALALAKKALDRARGVHTAGGAADKDLETAQSTYNQADAEQVRAHNRLLALNGTEAAQAKQLMLTAPQSGVITALSIAPGTQVGDPTATLMTVTNVDQVFVTANVAEGDVGDAAVGSDAAITLTAYPGRIFHGRVSTVNAVLEPDTRRQKVRIALANPDGTLLPNMYATVHLAGTPAGGVWVPQSALLMNNDTISVLREVRPWVFQRRIVRISDETDATAHVLSGLQAGDRVVVRGGVLLND